MNKLSFVPFSVVLACMVSGAAARAEDVAFVPLFDGQSLDGWHTQPGGHWQVTNGVIQGTSAKQEQRHGLLVTDKQYSDFTVRLAFKVASGNSGFYFRSDKAGGQVGIHGFQAEVDNSKSVAGLYETAGRAWVKQPDAELITRVYRPGEWNEMTVTAVGRDVTVTLNGHETVALTNDPGRVKGHIALQLHGGQDMEVYFKDIAIHEIVQDENSGFAPMFNGKDLTGWQTTGNWVVEDENVIGLQPRPGESGWKRFKDYIMTTRPYGDFVLDLEFKFAPQGNSGVFLRVGDLTDPVSSGMEVQILDTHGKENVGHHDCGGVILTAAPSKNMVKPAGEWNHYTIRLVGHSLNVVLNGEQIIDLDLSTSAAKDRPMKGYIGFQDEAKRVWFRNVRIREID